MQLCSNDVCHLNIFYVSHLNIDFFSYFFIYCIFSFLMRTFNLTLLSVE